MLACFIRGLNSSRPALFNTYTTCQPEHGVGDDASARQAKYALESRAFPFMVYDPDAGDDIAGRVSLDGNPFVEQDWPAYTLEYRDETNPDETRQMELPYTFADFAATEGRFAKHFSLLPANASDEHLIPLHEYLALDAGAREQKTPFIWMVDDANCLRRAAVSESLAASTEERLHFWRMLQELGGIRNPQADKAADRARRETAAAYEAQIKTLTEQHQADLNRAIEQARTESAQQIAKGLVSLVNGNGVDAAALNLRAPDSPAAEQTELEAGSTGAVEPASNGRRTNGNKTAAPPPPVEVEETTTHKPRIDTLDCTTCGECIAVNPRMFKYNEDEQAYIADATAGPYRDLVVAAERCPVEIIHPGHPLNPDEAGLETWLRRAEPFLQ